MHLQVNLCIFKYHWPCCFRI